MKSMFFSATKMVWEDFNILADNLFNQPLEAIFGHKFFGPAVIALTKFMIPLLIILLMYLWSRRYGKRPAVHFICVVLLTSVAFVFKAMFSLLWSFVWQTVDEIREIYNSLSHMSRIISRKKLDDRLKEEMQKLDSAEKKAKQLKQADAIDASNSEKIEKRRNHIVSKYDDRYLSDKGVR
ncbi:MAG: hypothetical protein UT66_C0020G0012 [candidate division CPR2 bacterium GW2011_GWC1_39_9]|uniref:Uncharacterized protein n=1 Tax=candidate division CPR2 bacterium GW2011_GWC2_39_10 TaxID=1618345 RepID=A0A0G0P9L2_UNCC2|nr:MAG: hypothetical protein UT18_C0007G0075 [candidate division CPR2 bacterium GW2011_GWC2_39_10]KKR34579.1 MAG: hypothetical protein UT66_C0020G0012 [candidate division CPR2 bacterium GW2011_GWC1_39_9]